MISSQDKDEVLGTGEGTSQCLRRGKLQVTQSFNCEKSPKDFELCVSAMDPVNSWCKRLCCHWAHRSCSPEESSERVCTCPPLSHSHLPACACFCNPAASPIILSADPCLMVVSSLQHHQLSDCCTLCTLTWQLKMIYKWSFQFQIESSKRLWCSLWYQRHPSILAAAAFAFAASVSLGFHLGYLLSKGCFFRALCRAGGMSRPQSAFWR